MTADKQIFCAADVPDLIATVGISPLPVGLPYSANSPTLQRVPLGWLCADYPDSRYAE